MGEKSDVESKPYPGTFGYYATQEAACPRCAAPKGVQCSGDGIGVPEGLIGTLRSVHDERCTAHYGVGWTRHRWPDSFPLGPDLKTHLSRKLQKVEAIFSGFDSLSIDEQEQLLHDLSTRRKKKSNG